MEKQTDFKKKKHCFVRGKSVTFYHFKVAEVIENRKRRAKTKDLIFVAKIIVFDT